MLQTHYMFLITLTSCKAILIDPTALLTITMIFFILTLYLNIVTKSLPLTVILKTYHENFLSKLLLQLSLKKEGVHQILQIKKGMQSSDIILNLNMQ